jgi:molybdopterin/thiamine biosynthesis adenylyltransferase
MSRSEDRLAQAGADVLRIAGTSVLVVADLSPASEPWRHPAWPLCRGLGALGFGCVHLWCAEEHHDDIAELMEGFPFVPDVAPAPGRWASGAPACDVVLSVGNDVGLRNACARLARARSSRFASVSWGTTWVSMASPTGVTSEPATEDRRFAVDAEPLSPIARIAAGLALQEALTSAGRVEAAVSPEPVVCFDAAAEARTPRAHGRTWPPVCIESEIVEVIGAGAIGTNFLESLAPVLGPGCELRIFDFDQVGPENLAIQAAFSPEDVGRWKATVMAERLAPLCDPALDIRPLVLGYEDRPASLSLPSLRVVCPDRFATRKHANDRSLADGVPLVEAASSPLAAQQRSYLPGWTACLEHRIPRLAARAAREGARASCSEEHALTLPGTNMICGGILAAEALRTLRPEALGGPSSGTVVYDARFPQRFGVVDVRPACVHS